MSRKSGSLIGRTVSDTNLGSNPTDDHVHLQREDVRLLATCKSDVVTYLNGNDINHRIFRRIDYGTSSSSSIAPAATVPPSAAIHASVHAPPNGRSGSHLQLHVQPFRLISSASRELLLSSGASPCHLPLQPAAATDKDADKMLTTGTGSLGSSGGGSEIGGARHDCKISGCRRLRINVSGQMYEVRIGVLNRHPKTLLGDQYKRRQFYDRKRKELFFDRHRPSFEAIFFYLQYGGTLRRPYHVPNDIFLDELLFYELEEEAIGDYKRSEGYTFDQAELPVNPLMRKVWMLFEYPETSRAAFGVAVMSVIMTTISIILFCVETLPVFATSHCVADEAPNFFDPFFVIETTCTLWFTLELVVRFIACPDKLVFWKDLKNIVDATAVFPYYVTLVNVLSTMSCSSAKSSASLSFLRVIRLVRVFKLTKHSVGLQILMLTFKASLEGLGLFLVALFVSLLVFSSAIYYAELGNPKSNMESIPDAFWWAIITMTTVGYGDKVPVGNTGKLIGAACAITGVLTLAIPVPIITGHFNRFYAYKTGRGRHV